MLLADDRQQQTLVNNKTLKHHLLQWHGKVQSKEHHCDTDIGWIEVYHVFGF